MANTKEMFDGIDFLDDFSYDENEDVGGGERPPLIRSAGTFKVEIAPGYVYKNEKGERMVSPCVNKGAKTTSIKMVARTVEATEDYPVGSRITLFATIHSSNPDQKKREFALKIGKRTLHCAIGSEPKFSAEFLQSYCAIGYTENKDGSFTVNRDHKMKNSFMIDVGKLAANGFAPVDKVYFFKEGMVSHNSHSDYLRTLEDKAASGLDDIDQVQHGKESFAPQKGSVAPKKDEFGDFDDDDLPF